jgi:endonuclease I
VDPQTDHGAAKATGPRLAGVTVQPRRAVRHQRGGLWSGLLAVAWVAVPLRCAAGEPLGYYDNARGRTGTALRQALHDIIDDHTALSYAATRDALRAIDEDPGNPDNVILIYARESKPKADFLPAPDGWNREHLWPQSYGIDGAEPAYSDLFNLRAEDENVNADRGNLVFDESLPADGGFADAGGIAEAPLCSRDANSWEPPDIVKGDVARALFYMDVRYEGSAAGETDLQLTDDLAAVSTSAARMGRLTTLLVWDRLDPVDDVERLRHERIFSLYQHNRNPFIDHPEWVSMVYHDVLDLQAQWNSTAVTLSWPADLGDHQAIIESSRDLANWMPVGGVPVTTGGRKILSHEATGPRAFYRMRLR